MIAALVWGIGTGSNWVLAHSSLQRQAGEDVIGRLAAFDELLVTTAMVLSAFAGAAAFSTSGLAAVPLIGSVLGVLGVIVFALAVLAARREVAA